MTDDDARWLLSTAMRHARSRVTDFVLAEEIAAEVTAKIVAREQEHPAGPEWRTWASCVAWSLARHAAERIERQSAREIPTEDDVLVTMPAAPTTLVQSPARYASDLTSIIVNLRLRGHTQMQIASLVGVNQSAVSKILAKHMRGR